MGPADYSLSLTRLKACKLQLAASDGLQIRLPEERRRIERIEQRLEK
jgi:hypothetical protein